MSRTLLCALLAGLLLVPSSSTATIAEDKTAPTTAIGLSIALPLVPLVVNCIEIANGRGSPLWWTVPSMVLGSFAIAVGAYMLGNLPSTDRNEFHIFSTVSIGVGVGSLVLGVVGAWLYEPEPPAGERPPLAGG